MCQHLTCALGILVSSFAFLQEQLGEHETAQTGTGIQTGQCEYGYRQREQCVDRTVCLGGLGTEHGCNTCSECSCGRSELTV